MNLSSRWEDGKIIIQEVEYSDNDSEALETRVVQGITATSEEWLKIAITALSFMPGKPSDDGPGYALCPYGADPEMIGALVAEKLRNAFPAS